MLAEHGAVGAVKSLLSADKAQSAAQYPFDQGRLVEAIVAYPVICKT